MPATTSSRRSSPSRPTADKEAEGRRVQRLIGLSQVCDRVDRSRWWVRAAVLAGTFPAPVSTGSRSAKWVESEVDDWIGGLIAARDAAA